MLSKLLINKRTETATTTTTTTTNSWTKCVVDDRALAGIHSSAQGRRAWRTDDGAHQRWYLAKSTDGKAMGDPLSRNPSIWIMKKHDNDVLLDWMMTGGWSRLNEEAHYRKEWRRWKFEPAWTQRTWRRRSSFSCTSLNWPLIGIELDSESVLIECHGMKPSALYWSCKLYSCWIKF